RLGSVGRDRGRALGPGGGRILPPFRAALFPRRRTRPHYRERISRWRHLPLRAARPDLADTVLREPASPDHRRPGDLGWLPARRATARCGCVKKRWKILGGLVVVAFVAAAAPI